MQYPLEAAQRRTAAAKIASPYISCTEAVKEAADPAAIGALPDPHPPTQWLATAVKEQIQKEMDELNPFKARKIRRHDDQARVHKPLKQEAADPGGHKQSQAIRSSRASKLQARSKVAKSRGISFAKDVQTTKAALGLQPDEVRR
jgi:hypothetical protein